MDRRLLAFGGVMLGVVAIAVTVAVVGFVGIDGIGTEYEIVWETDPATEYSDNHHDPAVATVDGSAVIGVPLNDHDEADTCGIVAYDATGDQLWRDRFDPADCSPHAIGDVGVGEIDGEPVFLTPDETETLRGYHAVSGDVLFEYDLDGMGYSRPIAADVTGDGTDEFVVADFDGTVHVVDADGEAVWTRSFEGTMANGPLVDDFTDDGSIDIAVTPRQGGNAEIVLLDADGDEQWRADAGSGVASWTGATIADGAGEEAVLVAAIGRGEIVAYRVGDGTVRWESQLQDASVHVGETSPGRVHVAGTGSVWSVDLQDGGVVWRQNIGSEDDYHGPAVGDVTGDGDLDVAIAGTGATVGVLSAQTGSVTAVSGYDGTFHVSPVLVDVTGDGSEEVVIYRGDGSILVLAQ